MRSLFFIYASTGCLWARFADLIVRVWFSCVCCVVSGDVVLSLFCMSPEEVWVTFFFDS